MKKFILGFITALILLGLVFGLYILIGGQIPGNQPGQFNTEQRERPVQPMKPVNPINPQ
ncbi:MAG: hypothetical protein WC741_02240 [Patescibacteria group bacterium]|jgi:hypothetical protein